ncbi:MAG: ribonuclease III [Methylococcales bacterium]|nr:ribonuclease III [Methylococcales bacterium]
MIKTPEALRRKLNLPFNDLALLTQALTHRSACQANNERLEFLGDAVLGLIVAEELFQRFPAAPEGVLSRLRASLVNQHALAELARLLNLGDYLILGSGELKSGGFRRESILSDALEAIIGALFLDQGLETCKTWVKTLMQERFQQLNLNNWQKDPKTRLQEWLQAKKQPLPSYDLINMTGMDHEQRFVVRCQIESVAQTTDGFGASRKKAEQQAAQRMLDLLEHQGTS